MMMGYAPTVSALGLEDRDPNNPEDLKEVTYWVGVAVEQLQDLWWNFMRLNRPRFSAALKWWTTPW